jgi:hypothetical protein
MLAHLYINICQDNLSSWKLRRQKEAKVAMYESFEQKEKITLSVLVFSFKSESNVVITLIATPNVIDKSYLGQL